LTNAQNIFKLLNKNQINFDKERYDTILKKLNIYDDFYEIVAFYFTDIYSENVEDLENLNRIANKKRTL